MNQSPSPALVFQEGPLPGSTEWFKAMRRYGELLADHGVRQIILVHGTFVGTDALGLFQLLSPALNQLTGSSRLTRSLQHRGKRLLNQLTGDAGNFIPAYSRLLEQGLGHGLSCSLFHWGSGNCHLARVQAAVKLLQRLAALSAGGQERVLLIGHSHAGQVFALVTQLLAEADSAGALKEVIHRSAACQNKDLEVNLAAVRHLHLDMVTWGTPIRYRWGRWPHHRLLALVNHRTPVHISGLLTTRDGDYIQQWGGAGTDAMPLAERALNDALDDVLDCGRSLTLIAESLGRGERDTPRFDDGTLRTTQLLVDYADQAQRAGVPSLAWPNALRTVFGHGVYTRELTLLFNTAIIARHLYSAGQRF